VYAYDGNHNDITRISGIYSGSLSERWHGEVLNGIGVLNNTVDVPQMWTDFDASQKLENLANWPPDLRAKFLRPWKNFLFAGNLTQVGGAGAGPRPFSVRWSQPAAPGTIPDSWDIANPAKQCGERDLAETDDYVVDAKELGSQMIVYKQKSAHAFNYIYPNPSVFASRSILSKGILTRDCVQKFPKGHFCVGLNDIYIHTGAENSDVSIVETRLREWIFNQIDSSNYFYCYTYMQEKKSEICFAFPEAGETYPNVALVWNWVTNSIGVRDLHHSPFIYPGAILVSVDDDIWGSDNVETFRLTTEAGDPLITDGGDHIVWS
jgi:hypothetical protein